MELKGGDMLVVVAGKNRVRWKISAIDSRVVKIFAEDGQYMQMPYSTLRQMIKAGCVIVEESGGGLQ
jgi:hypothetical protein